MVALARRGWKVQGRRREDSLEGFVRAVIVAIAAVICYAKIVCGEEGN